MTTGPLKLEPARPRLEALAGRLLARGVTAVRVLDSAGRVVLNATSEGESRCPEDAECLEFLENSARCRASVSGETENAEGWFTCPRGQTVKLLPIKRSSVSSGSLIVCGLGSDGDEGVDTAREAIGSIVETLAESSAKDREIDSLAGELALRYEELELLYEIDQRIPLRSHTSSVIDYVAKRALECIDCFCLAWVAAPAAQSLNCDECKIFWKAGAPKEPDAELRLEAEHLARVVGDRCLRAGEPITMTSMAGDPELRPLASQLDSVISLPVRVEHDTYGCLIAFSSAGNQFTSNELKIMTALTKKSAFVIRDSGLYEDLESLFFNLIKLLVNTIENKDEYTKGHSQRVKTFTVRLAELMDLPKADIEVLNLSGLLHDIGKQGIPDAVLKKEGRLTDEERAMINTHPIRGVNLIQHIKQFESCLPHIRHHHERMDGKGYPDGLTGKQIPLGARIIAVADTFDALTSDRCYRPRFSTEKAFGIIEEVAGTQLDVDIASLLLSNRNEFVNRVQTAKLSSQ